MRVSGLEFHGFGRRVVGSWVLGCDGFRMLRVRVLGNCWVYLIPVPLGRKKDPFCSYIRKPVTQKVKRIPNTDGV